MVYGQLVAQKPHCPGRVDPTDSEDGKLLSQLARCFSFICSSGKESVIDDIGKRKMSRLPRERMNRDPGAHAAIREMHVIDTKWGADDLRPLQKSQIPARSGLHTEKARFSCGRAVSNDP